MFFKANVLLGRNTWRFSCWRGRISFRLPHLCKHNRLLLLRSACLQRAGLQVPPEYPSIRTARSGEFSAAVSLQSYPFFVTIAFIYPQLLSRLVLTVTGGATVAHRSRRIMQCKFFHITKKKKTRSFTSLCLIFRLVRTCLYMFYH